jgi:hypothetical protein
MSKRQPRTRRSSTAAKKYVAGYDVDDRSTWPQQLKPWQLAVLREADRRLQKVVEAEQAKPRVVDEADSGRPRGRLLFVAEGMEERVIPLRDGGYVRVVVPALDVRREQ